MSDEDRRDRLVGQELWTPADAAFMLGVAKSTVLRWIRAGMPATEGRDAHAQRVWVLRADDVHDWVADTRERSTSQQ